MLLLIKSIKKDISPVIYGYITTYYYHEGYTQLLIIMLHPM
uniref:Uncharacterized protein n=1 Tax=Lepeophtheirus salmonis TaxID=72036 RepID=A0A0K2U3M0_LEPSM